MLVHRFCELPSDVLFVFIIEHQPLYRSPTTGVYFPYTLPPYQQPTPTIHTHTHTLSSLPSLIAHPASSSPPPQVVSYLQRQPPPDIITRGLLLAPLRYKGSLVSVAASYSHITPFWQVQTLYIGTTPEPQRTTLCCQQKGVFFVSGRFGGVSVFRGFVHPDTEPTCQWAWRSWA